MIVNGGLFKQATDAVLETRGAVVEEQAAMWKAELKMEEYVPGVAMRDLEEILTDLVSQKLLTTDEANTVKTDPDNEVTIGSRTISFKAERS